LTIAEIAAEVAAAIGQLEEGFPGRISFIPDGTGGANVTVAELELGPRWTRERADLTFNVPYNYPHAPIYPYYLPAGTTPQAGLPQALQQVQWQGQQVVQVSLRNTNWDPSRDNAVGCVLQVRAWARKQ